MSVKNKRTRPAVNISVLTLWDRITVSATLDIVSSTTLHVKVSPKPAFPPFLITHTLCLRPHVRFFVNRYPGC